MKLIFIYFITLMYLVFSTVVAANDQEKSIESNTVDLATESTLLPENSVVKEPELNFLPSPQIRITDEIIYVSGGIGKEELNEMKEMVNEYPLEIVLVQKTNDGGEGYISDVNVQISDANGNVVLDIYTNGPILLVDLPNGKYHVIAEYNNVFRANRVTIGSKKNRRIVLLWPK